MILVSLYTQKLITIENMVIIDPVFGQTPSSLNRKLFLMRNRLPQETLKSQAWQQASPRALSTAGLCQLGLLVVLARP